MSNTDVLRDSEAALLPPGFVQGHRLHFRINDYDGIAEVDGWHPESREAIEICQGGSGGPKPGQKRKLASDALKLIFLREQGLISTGRMFVTNPEWYTWLHQSGSWLSAACRFYGIHVELKRHGKKQLRKKIRNVIHQARTERH